MAVKYSKLKIKNNSLFDLTNGFLDSSKKEIKDYEVENL